MLDAAIAGPCDSSRANDPQLALGLPQSGTLDAGERTCLSIPLEQGGFARLSIEIEAGVVEAKLFPPAASSPVLNVEVWGQRSFPTPVSWDARVPGAHRLMLDARVRAGHFTVEVAELLSAREQAERTAALRRDPRVQWLRQHGLRLRSITPSDTDFSDLEPLKQVLRGVRVVLLGEFHHGDGSDFEAKTRLVRFLHEELGFDVLAFESPLYGTSKAWNSLRAGTPPREAFLEGVVRVWGWSQQVQPLIEYLAERARSGSPLELSGFDLQSGERAAVHFAPELVGFLRRHGIARPLADSESTEHGLLRAFVEGRVWSRSWSMPESTVRSSFLRELRETAALIDASVPTREGALWAQLLRITEGGSEGAFEQVLNPQRRPSPSSVRRERLMAETLVWLADSYFRGRKIIVWAHNGHVVRNPQRTGWSGYDGLTMGHGVWEAFRDESFVIASSSYDGAYHWATQPDERTYSIVADPHPAVDFEELMAAAGFEFGLVNLRAAAHQGAWLREPFFARMLPPGDQQAPWTEVVDAILFIRTQKPSLTTAEPQ